MSNKKETINYEQFIIRKATTLYNKQDDISYCQSETNIYDITNINDAIKFLCWITDFNNFEYEYKGGRK